MNGDGYVHRAVLHGVDGGKKGVSGPCDPLPGSGEPDACEVSLSPMVIKNEGPGHVGLLEP